MRKLWLLSWICSRIERKLGRKLKINLIAHLRFQSIWNKTSLNLCLIKILKTWIIIQISHLQLLESKQIKFWVNLINQEKLRIIKLCLKNQIHKMRRRDHTAWKCDQGFSKVSMVHWQRLNFNLKKLIQTNRRTKSLKELNLPQREHWRRILTNQTLKLTEEPLSTFWKPGFQTSELITKKLAITLQGIRRSDHSLSWVNRGQKHLNKLGLQK